MSELFERPTLNQLIERIQADAEARSGKKYLRRSLVGVLTRVFAAVAHGLYGFIEFVLRQTFTSTAETTFLERRASEYGIYRKQATKAEGRVTFVGQGVVPEGTQLQASDGTLYQTLTNSVEFQAPIEAVEPGRAGNKDEGTVLSLVVPVQGIQTDAIAGAIEGGADTEDDVSLRGRLLDRQRNPPRAGTKNDYVQWALQVPGVTRAWCYPLELGPGRVTVRFMTDGMTENGIPDAAMIAKVKEHIESEKPVTAILEVVAPIPKKLDMRIDMLLADISQQEAVKAKVKNSVSQVIVSGAEPGNAILLTALNRAVSSVSEIVSFRILSPVDDVKTSTGEILIPGEITFE